MYDNIPVTEPKSPNPSPSRGLSDMTKVNDSTLDPNNQTPEQELRDDIDWALTEHGSDVAAKLGFPSDPEVYDNMYKPNTHNARVDQILELFATHYKAQGAEAEKRIRVARVESVDEYINTCLASGVQPSMKTLLEFQAGQKLALAELSKESK